ncbi:putative nucleotidyltransferase with HDIG domain [Paenibacillus phyllosphaerae]|uniref:Putative nucleotidyltransferase with HDIG domain n=1 Tax=Paenibacillus phyllosphaerae TaxID=274593 RepID=A0A7W5FPC8_9BACL|nr:HD-GYP domain-containing protein [Paenibacillus phyllosphaerae]MBB3112210.1 putative nucleotidyltransferase with HDIG domain [Paenibacillus phyllosphaerae]
MRVKGRTALIGGPLLATILPLVGYEWLRSSAAYDLMIHSPHGHFYIVSIIAALSTILAVAVGFAGYRLRNIKVEFLALAYLSLAELFILHGLSTPGFLMHDSSLPGIASQLSLLLAVIWLCLSAASTDNPIVQWLARRRMILMPVWGGVLALLCAAAFFAPEVIQSLPISQKPYNWISATLTVFGCLWTIVRYRRSYLAAGFPLQQAIVYSTGLIIAAQYIMTTGEAWRLSWWLYHVLLVGSMLVMIDGLGRQYFAQGSFQSSLRVLFKSDPRAWLEACITPSVRALIMATEVRDAYTAGHNMRVALYALRLAEEMGRSTEELRAIAQGGVVHDVGKIKVPDAVLNKPGKLSPEERSLIERHPVWGYDVCKQLGFFPDELSIIRSHHEKWDGTGYPDRLAGERIPLLARIAAVADVYDALTSSRSYRKAMSHDEAMRIIVEGSGTHFDPMCVEAWQRLGTSDEAFLLEIAASDRYIRLVPNKDERAISG